MDAHNIMDTKDEVFSISNPRLLSAVYFSLLAIIVTIAIDMVVYALGIKQFLPVATEIFLGVIVAACFGALFGKLIVYSLFIFVSLVLYLYTSRALVCVDCRICCDLFTKTFGILRCTIA